MKNIRKLIPLLTLCLVAFCFSCSEPIPLKALIISGQNNHNWQVSHQALKLILDNLIVSAKRYHHSGVSGTTVSV